MSETMELLYREHADMTKLLNILDREIAVLDEGGVPDYETVDQVLDYCLNYPDLCHHPKEDLVLRALRKRDPVAADFVGDLEASHGELANQTRRFAAAVQQILNEANVPRDWFGEIARKFLKGYRHHMEMEDEFFFPAALKHLTEEDWAEVDANLPQHADPLFGSQVEQKYEDLRERILKLEEEEAQSGAPTDNRFLATQRE